MIRCRAGDAIDEDRRVSLRRFVLLGLLTEVPTMFACLLALRLA